MIPAFSLSAMAADTESEIDLSAITDGGKITIDTTEYVVIRSVDALNNAIAADTANANSYILDADLNYSGKTFKKIVLDQGIFDGNGHAMYGYSLTNSGTFEEKASTSKITIRNLTLGTPDTTGHISITVSNSHTGALIGDARPASLTIENVTAYANFSITSGNMVGGFEGYAATSMYIRNCTLLHTILPE